MVRDAVTVRVSGRIREGGAYSGSGSGSLGSLLTGRGCVSEDVVKLAVVDMSALSARLTSKLESSFEFGDVGENDTQSLASLGRTDDGFDGLLLPLKAAKFCRGNGHCQRGAHARASNHGWRSFMTPP